jgi:hypothetical protein
MEAEVRLYSDRAMWTTRLFDISLKGALVERPLGWEGTTGKTQRLEIRVSSAHVISVNAASRAPRPRASRSASTGSTSTASSA